MVIDKERLTAERPMLNRLAVGLIGEGVRLTRLVPEEAVAESEWEKAIALAARIEYSSQILPWLRRRRVQQIVTRFEKNLPDVIYASGRRAWRMALDLGDAIDRPVAIDVWAQRLLGHIPRVKSSTKGPAFIAATEPIATELRQRVPPELVAVVPVGVGLQTAVHEGFAKRESVATEGAGRPRDAESIISFAVLGYARDVSAYRALLTAIAEISDEFPELRAFIELNGAREHDIWRLIRSMGLLESTSSLARAQAHRQLLTQCDAALLPESSGEVRTLVLDLMGAGVPIVSREDPYLDYLIGGRTAILVEEATPEAWREAISNLLQQPSKTQELTTNGREWVQAHHRSSAQVEQLFNVFERMRTGGAYRLSEQGGTLKS